MNEPVAVAVLAKAPLPGFAKTRLIPALGEEGAALLQARLVEHAVETVCAACLGPVTLWAAPNESHPLFQGISARFGVALARQDPGDLGARMLTAMAAANAPALIVGTDCPALTSDHLRAAADILRDGIYELRVRFGSVNYRLLYGFHGQTTAILAHGLVKEAEVPAADIDIAIARMTKFSENPGVHTYVRQLPQRQKGNRQ